MRSKRAILRAGVAVAPVLFATVASAGVIRHDRPDSAYTSLAANPAFQSVGLIQVTAPGGGFSCSGALIAPDIVLTAGHCVLAPAGASATFSVGGTTTSVTGSFVTSGFISALNAGQNVTFSGEDIAILRLSSPITHITPATFYNGTDLLGRRAVTAGYGLTGDGLTGIQGGSAGTFRAGENIIDAFGDDPSIGADSRMIIWDFDNPDNPADSAFGDTSPLDLEYLAAPGDSGGPAFVEEDGLWSIVGVGSFLGSFDPTADGDYGDVAGFTMTQPHMGFINSFIPAPGTATLLAFGCVAGLRSRRRAIE